MKIMTVRYLIILFIFIWVRIYRLTFSPTLLYEETVLPFSPDYFGVEATDSSYVADCYPDAEVTDSPDEPGYPDAVGIDLPDEPDYPDY
jgi:hypothetical protein